MLIRGWELSRLFENEAAGAGEGGGGAGGSDASGTAAAAPAAEASTSEYSATDPGYSFDDAPAEPVDELAALKSENQTEQTPAGDESADAGGDTEETAPAEPPVESAESDEGFSDALLDRAAALGYTFEDIKGFRSAKSLEKEVARVERLQQRMTGRKPAEPEQTPLQTQAQLPAEPDFSELDQLVADGFLDERVANMQKQMQMQAWQRAVAAEQRAQQAESGLQQLVQVEQQRAFDAHVRRFDSTIASLGEEYESLFGKGSMAEVKKSSPDLAQNRIGVFQKYQQLKDTYLLAKQPLPPERELIEEAVHARFWKQTKTLARKELTNDIKKAGSQALSRPRSTGTQQLVGQAAASAKEQDFWKRFDS